MDDREVAEFARAFQGFRETMSEVASPDGAPLCAALEAHLGIAREDGTDSARAEPVPPAAGWFAYAPHGRPHRRRFPPPMS